MDRWFCIHGHFYQPPREDPWLREILPEGSAAPCNDWNQRIARESYAPLAWARRLDGQGRIAEIVNAYEWISFNFGPTLLDWMEREDPSTYARVLSGDRVSRERWGHGNAMAQVCHHAILPLATPLDKELEVRWGLEDFKARYGREAEGMWLAEAAVDTPTLEILAENGVRFTILAPRQIEAVTGDDAGEFRPVQEWEVDVHEPYLVELPSGRSIAVFIYNGPISQAVAFQRLLESGEGFLSHLRNAARPGLLSVATDGETYGHHFKFGEMALAYVLAETRGERSELKPTNYAAFLAMHPPRRRARIREASSWSCVHGVERWRSDCGCTDGGHPGWRQGWRAPLRETLNLLKARVDDHFFRRSAALFRDPRRTLLDYGRVRAGSTTQDAFAADHFIPGLSEPDAATAWKLLLMQEWALSSFASCAWFFDELSRLEPMNALAFALRAMDLGRETGMADPEPELVAILEKAVSNIPEKGTGRELWRSEILPRRETPASLAAQGLLRLWGEERLPGRGECAEVAWRGVRLRFCVDQPVDDGRVTFFTGSMGVAWELEGGGVDHHFEWEAPHGVIALASLFRAWPERDQRGMDRSPLSLGDLPWNKRQGLAAAFAAAAEESLRCREEELARDGAPLFQPFVEAQVTQTLGPRWARLAGGLAMAYARGRDFGSAHADLLDFLRSNPGGAAERENLTRRVEEELHALLNGERPRWEEVAKRLGRVAELGMTVDLWRPQNRYWELRATGMTGSAMAEAGRMLRFAEA